MWPQAWRGCQAETDPPVSQAAVHRGGPPPAWSQLISKEISGRLPFGLPRGLADQSPLCFTQLVAYLLPVQTTDLALSFTAPVFGEEMLVGRRAVYTTRPPGLTPAPRGRLGPRTMQLGACFQFPCREKKCSFYRKYLPVS